MNTPENHLTETPAPSTETYLDALSRMPLNGLLYRVLFGSEEEQRARESRFQPLS